MNYIRKTFGLAMDAEETYIMGMSMGGFGALHTALYYPECFGDLETVEESDHNPETLVRRLKENRKKIPDIYMSCSTEDFFPKNNRRMNLFTDGHFINTYLSSSDSSFT